MRLPFQARSTLSLMALMAASTLLGACSADTLAPKAAETRSIEETSPFTPTEASTALIGITDGTYRFDIDPTVPNKLYLGANMLSLPAGAICDLATSSYGSATWNDQCAPQKARLTITAVVKNAATRTPSIDFYPAMRFSPATNVSLYMFVGHGIWRQSNSLVIYYCNDDRVCVDESLTDPSLVTKTDRSKSIVFRRIKHFSGYIISTGATDDGGQSPQ